MFGFVIGVHMLVCLLLILVVLVQQGRGGGLIDSLSSAESLFGTKTNTLLVKSTSVLAVAFFVSCLALAFMSIQKNKSLLETRPPVPAQTAAATPTAPSTPSAPSTTPQTPSTTTTPSTPVTAGPASVPASTPPASGATQTATS